jgi:hypothetical protein
MGCRRCAKAEAWPTPRSSNSCDEHDHETLDDAAPTAAESAGRADRITVRERDTTDIDVIAVDANGIRGTKTVGSETVGSATNAPQPRGVDAVDVAPARKRRGSAVGKPSSGSGSMDTGSIGTGSIDTASLDAALARSGDIAFFKRRSPQRPARYSGAHTAHTARMAQREPGSAPPLAQGSLDGAASPSGNAPTSGAVTSPVDAASPVDLTGTIDEPASADVLAGADREDGRQPTGTVDETSTTSGDPFDRTLRTAVAEAGLRLDALARHVPVLRRLVGAGQSVLLVARCGPLDQPNRSDHLMVVTRDRVVITSESRSLRRARVHLNAAVAALLNVRWRTDTETVEFAATAIDGVRERFLIEAPDSAAVSRVDAVLGYVFRPAGTRRFNPVEPVMPSWMNPAGAY